MLGNTQDVENNKKLFSTYRRVLFKACSKGFAHFAIARIFYSDFARKQSIHKLSPTFWYFSYMAHSECAASSIIRIIEKRDNPNPKNITIYKYLNFVEQNIEDLFGNDKQTVIKEFLKNDRSFFAGHEKIIISFMNLRDNLLSHFDKEYFTAPLALKNIGFEDDDLELLYLELEKILNIYSFLFDGTKMNYELSAWKVTFQMEFKAFED